MTWLGGQNWIDSNDILTFEYNYVCSVYNFSLYVYISNIIFEMKNLFKDVKKQVISLWASRYRYISPKYIFEGKTQKKCKAIYFHYINRNYIRYMILQRKNLKTQMYLQGYGRLSWEVPLRQQERNKKNIEILFFRNK